MKLHYDVMEMILCEQCSIVFPVNFKEITLAFINDLFYLITINISYNARNALMGQRLHVCYDAEVM
jgi:hypothetical protein